MGKYDDIIRLERPVSEKHPPMPIKDRAAQFSPFAALTGYDAAIQESGRLTENAVELDENVKCLVNEKLLWISEHLNEAAVTIKYYRPDERKTGGTYIEITGPVKKIDRYRKILVMENEENILIDKIVNIEVVEE